MCSIVQCTCPVDFYVSYDPLVSYINDLRSNGSITGVEVWRVKIAIRPKGRTGADIHYPKLARHSKS